MKDVPITNMLNQIDTVVVPSVQPQLSRHPQVMNVNDDNVEFVSRILFVIVLYKVRLTESLTFQSLSVAVQSFLPHNHVDLLICDNSPTPQFDVNESVDNNHFRLYYLHDSTNPGISRSYNIAAEIASTKEKKWLLVLDQDTTIPVDGIQKYVNGLRAWPGFPIYTPQVYFDTVMLSPCRYFMHRGSPLVSIKSGVHHTEGKNVINSGLLISTEAYQKAGGYDENVWLYFSDFVFFDRLKKHFKNFIVLDCRIEHELSSSDYSDLSFAISRFSYYCRGAREASVSSGGVNAYLGYGVTVGLRSILMCRRFKNMSFLMVFVKSFLSKQI